MQRFWSVLGLGALCLIGAESASAAIISFANVAGGIWSTGLNSSGTALTGGSVDPHYVLIQNPSGCSGIACQENTTAGNLFGPSLYVVLGPNGTYPLNGDWLADDASSEWLGPRPDQTNPVVGGATFPNVGIYASDTDFYAYRLVFNLTALGLDPTTAIVDLAWASDAAVNSEIRLCSVASAASPVCSASSGIANSGNSGPLALTDVSITNGLDNAVFASGLMALDFLIFNPVVAADGLNPSGMRVNVISATTGNIIVIPPTGVPEPDALSLLGAGMLGLALMHRRRAALAIQFRRGQ